MKAEKGDLIRIVKEKRFNDDTVEDFILGNIYEVTEVDSDGDVTFVDSRGDNRYIYDHSQYVIHRKAGEEECRPAREFLAELRAEETLVDAVNHPNHYTQGKFETIEIIEEITKGYDDGFVSYCVGNTLKYIARAPFKHGTPSEDLAKAKRYIEFAIEYLDAKSTQK